MFFKLINFSDFCLTKNEIEKNFFLFFTKFIGFISKSNICLLSNATLFLKIEFNSFLLEFYGSEFVKENGKFKIKENRKVVIDNFNDKEIVHEPKIKITKETKQKEEPKKPLRNKFKIESLGGKKLKLVKL